MPRRVSSSCFVINTMNVRDTVDKYVNNFFKTWYSMWTDNMLIFRDTCHQSSSRTNQYSINKMQERIKNTKNYKRKGRDLTQSHDKSPYTDRKIQKATWQHKNANKTFDYTTIADRLRTVSWGNDSHPTGVVKPVSGIPTLSITTTVV